MLLLRLFMRCSSEILIKAQVYLGTPLAQAWDTSSARQMYRQWLVFKAQVISIG